MTKEEYFNECCDIRSLCQFCIVNNYIREIIDSGYIDEAIEEDIREFLRNDYWYNMNDLSEIPTGFNYYFRDGILEYYGIDEYDYDDLVVTVYDWAVEEGIIENDDSEDGEDDNFDEELYDCDPAEILAAVLTKCN